VFQIIFNEISAAEISGLDTMSQLELLNQFKVRGEDLENLDNENGPFGAIERGGQKLYRYRSKDFRIYFEVVEDNVVVHRVLNRNTFQDFLFRSKLPVNEDEALGDSKHFWSLIEEGENARRVQ
jgi:mRNA-degrading endonuclease RelE of RelBE toxin-antitoxin system